MKKITLKILNKLSKKFEVDNIFGLISILLSKYALNELDLGSLDEKEKELINEFLELLLNEDKELIDNLLKLDFEYKEIAKGLVLFFTIFLPEDVIKSKSPDKIKNALKIYPQEIQEAIIKSLEMLSILATPIEDDLKKEIIKEVIHIVNLIVNVMLIH